MIFFIHATIKAKLDKYKWEGEILLHDIYDIPETEIKEGFTIYLLERFCKVKIQLMEDDPEYFTTPNYYHSSYIKGDSYFSNVSIEVKYLNRIL